MKLENCAFVSEIIKMIDSSSIVRKNNDANIFREHVVSKGISFINKINKTKNSGLYYIEYNPSDDPTKVYNNCYFYILKYKNHYYIMDIQYGVVIRIEFYTIWMFSIHVADNIGCSSDMGFAAKSGLLTDFLSEFIGDKFLENENSNNFKIEAKYNTQLLNYVFSNNSKIKNILVDIELIKKQKEFLDTEKQKEMDYKSRFDKKEITKYIPNERLNTEDIKIPSYKSDTLYKPDNLELFFDKQEEGFDITIWGYNFDFLNTSNPFAGEGFIIDINNKLYIFDFEHCDHWIYEDKYNKLGYRKFDKNVDQKNFVRLFNKLEDVINYNSESDIELQKKIILAIISLIEIDLDYEILESLELSLFVENILHILKGKGINEN